MYFFNMFYHITTSRFTSFTHVFHKKRKGQDVQKSDHDENTNLAVNQLKSLNHLFDLFRALIGMSSIGIGMQKIAIHSQIIGLKAVLKISNIVSK